MGVELVKFWKVLLAGVLEVTNFDDFSLAITGLNILTTGSYEPPYWVRAAGSVGLPHSLRKGPGASDGGEFSQQGHQCWTEHLGLAQLNNVD